MYETKWWEESRESENLVHICLCFKVSIELTATDEALVTSIVLADIVIALLYHDSLQKPQACEFQECIWTAGHYSLEPVVIFSSVMYPLFSCHSSLAGNDI